MTDRELLELAAKVAGYHINKRYSYHEGLMLSTDGGLALWNPLDDDGDALRLAVKLRVNVVPEYVYEGPWLGRGSLRDPYAATRRAIVLAAAEIGKSM